MYPPGTNPKTINMLGEGYAKVIVSDVTTLRRLACLTSWNFLGDPRLAKPGDIVVKYLVVGNRAEWWDIVEFDNCHDCLDIESPALLDYCNQLRESPLDLYWIVFVDSRVMTAQRHYDVFHGLTMLRILT